VLKYDKILLALIVKLKQWKEHFMKKIFKKCMAFILITAMALGVLIYVPNTIEKAQADENNATAKTIAGLGTSVIADPAAPTGSWNGSYVYFWNI